MTKHLYEHYLEGLDLVKRSGMRLGDLVLAKYDNHRIPQSRGQNRLQISTGIVLFMDGEEDKIEAGHKGLTLASKFYVDEENTLRVQLTPRHDVRYLTLLEVQVLAPFEAFVDYAQTGNALKMKWGKDVITLRDEHGRCPRFR